ncbi:phage tail assembly protein [Bradyrhizobium diazoefficiens]|nr:phage tail assembly protein [Bradyrhizobium diazoefficiens]MBR0888893.1 phage tail assembly protein [Bradyrhizobium diazoefficiens]MBR0920598.1 phage tail assembly protein [Bradyrhizobium diazoefficiens]
MPEANPKLEAVADEAPPPQIKPLTFKLRKPVDAHGEKISEITFREPTGADIEAAGLPVNIDFAFDPPRIEFDARKMSAMMSVLAAVPPSTIRALAPKDWLSPSFFCVAVGLPLLFGAAVLFASQPALRSRSTSAENCASGTSGADRPSRTNCGLRGLPVLPCWRLRGLGRLPRHLLRGLPVNLLLRCLAVLRRLQLDLSPEYLDLVVVLQILKLQLDLLCCEPGVSRQRVDGHPSVAREVFDQFDAARRGRFRSGFHGLRHIGRDGVANAGHDLDEAHHQFAEISHLAAHRGDLDRYGQHVGLRQRHCLLDQQLRRLLRLLLRHLRRDVVGTEQPAHVGAGIHA